MRALVTTAVSIPFWQTVAAEIITGMVTLAAVVLGSRLTAKRAADQALREFERRVLVERAELAGPLYAELLRAATQLACAVWVPTFVPAGRTQADVTVNALDGTF